MIELAFTACSIVAGASCREVSLIYTDISLLTCVVGAQPQIAMWATEHPNWSVPMKWTCRAAGQYANI